MRSCIACEVQPVTLGSPRQQTTEVLSHFQVAFPDPKQTKLEVVFQGKHMGQHEILDLSHMHKLNTSFDHPH